MTTQPADIADDHGQQARKSSQDASGVPADAVPGRGTGGRLESRAVIPAQLAPPPGSTLGLAGYDGAGPGLWLTSCHGSASTTTLAAVISDSMSAGRYWPVPEPPAHSRVLLVARSHAAGLCAAQSAAWQWAAGVLPHVRLLGLALIADAPGKRPKSLTDLLKLVSGGVPRVWKLPWVEAASPRRAAAAGSPARLPAAYTRLIQDLDRIVSEDTHA
jgi:hypothetical protein